MKKILITIGLIVGLSAQSNAQGIKVTYVEKIQMPANIKELSPEIRMAVETQLKARNSVMSLYSHKGESIYTQEDKSSAEQPQQANTNVQTVRMGGGAVIYKNHNDKQAISQEYILDKKFLIAEPLNAPTWKTSKDEKSINGFKCQKAVNEAGDIAWFCPEIPVGEGPGNYFGLPGLILELETQSKIITVQEINLKYDASSKIIKPNDGKKITRDNFENIRKKKMEEMGVSGGGSGSGVRVIQM